jgi:hypothetical protein
MIVLLKDRGQTLRFWRATQIRLRPEALREFLKEETWQHTAPWSSAFAPGGKRCVCLCLLVRTPARG